MRFLDANIFIYAFYKPKRELTTLEKRMKDLSKTIITDVGNGKETVITTVVHISEVVNILKNSIKPFQLTEMVTGLMMLENLEILAVNKTDYFAATELGQELGLDPNDALAVQFMQIKNVAEIYSFDKAFERVEKITRLPIIPAT